MDRARALEILDIANGFSEKELKVAYYKMALIHHPDKSSDADASEKFNTVHEAYMILSADRHSVNDPRSLFRDGLTALFPGVRLPDLFTDDSVEEFLKRCQNLSLELFKGLSKANSLRLYRVLSNYCDKIELGTEMVSQMEKIVKERTKGDSVIVLSPNVDDLLAGRVYPLQSAGTTFQVPLWHKEVCFKSGEVDLIVKCIPQLERGVHLTPSGDISCILEKNICDVFATSHIPLKLGGLSLQIPVGELYIKPCQTYVFMHKGPPIASAQDIYSIRHRRHLCVVIQLH